MNVLNCNNESFFRRLDSRNRRSMRKVGVNVNVNTFERYTTHKQYVEYALRIGIERSHLEKVSSRSFILALSVSNPVVHYQLLRPSELSQTRARMPFFALFISFSIQIWLYLSLRLTSHWPYLSFLVVCELQIKNN